LMAAHGAIGHVVRHYPKDTKTTSTALDEFRVATCQRRINGFDRKISCRPKNEYWRLDASPGSGLTKDLDRTSLWRRRRTLRFPSPR
jgi:hypothetical protein